jgi:hypothetical protein
VSSSFVRRCDKNGPFVSSGRPGRLRIFKDDAGGDGPAGLSSLDAAEDLPLRLPQPPPVEPAAGTGSAAQYRADVADRAARARLQDDCRLPQGQWRGDPGGVSSVCGALPSAQTFHRCRCCDRRQQVQSGEQSRQELHGGQGRRADGTGGRQHRALPEGTGPGRPRRERYRRGQVGPAEGEDCRPAPTDAGLEGDGADGPGRT